MCSKITCDTFMYFAIWMQSLKLGAHSTFQFQALYQSIANDAFIGKFSMYRWISVKMLSLLQSE